jgi:hypothetical protein
MSLNTDRLHFVLLGVCLILSTETLGQSIGGTFFGVVKDLTGPVPQAQVQITNSATGQVRFVFTDDRGTYELREVPPGLYELKVSKDGYNTVTTPPAQGLQLGLAQVSRVDDITLTVAPAGSSEVEVSALDLAMTDSDRPTLSTAFTERQLRDLPLSARDINNLAPLAPGVVSVSSFSFANTLVPFSVNGSRGRDNNFIIDSVDNNEPLFGGAATQFTNSEIFSEFRILTGQFQAEYGRNSGSIINVVTKTGGKELHGSLFWYAQNDGLNAMTKVEKQSDLTKPARFYENQLGASLGGPIKKESTWYFLSYQWDRARNDLSKEYPVVATLPTTQGLAVLQGIESTNPTPTLAAFLADPTVNTVPFNLASPCEIPILNPPPILNANNPCTPGRAFWAPPPSTQPACADPRTNLCSIDFGTYLVPHGNVLDLRDHEGSVRIDQKLGQRENFFLRYLLDDLRTPLGVFSDPGEVAFSDLGLLPQWRTIFTERTQNFGSSWTHAFDRALNELRFSFSRISSERGPLNADPKMRELPQITVRNELDPGKCPDPLFCGTVFFASRPASGFAAAGNSITLGSDSRPARADSNLLQVQENFSSLYRRHSLKFGGNLITTRSKLRQINGDLGHYFYSSFSDFLNNTASRAPIVAYQRFGNLGGSGGEVLPLRELAQFYFAEDDIKLSSTFTLNLGVRYENYSQAFNRVVDLSAINFQSPPPLGRVNTNFAPRLGFAWAFENNTLLRGGYGIYYDPTFFNIALLAWQSGPISPYVFSNFGVNPVTSNIEPLEPSNEFPNRPFNTGDGTLQFSNLLTNKPSGCDQITDTPKGSTFLDCTNQNTVSKNLQNPFVHEASLSLQHQFQRDFLVELSYFASRGTRLFQRRDLNPHTGWGLPSPSQPCSVPLFPCAILRPRKSPNLGSIFEMSNGAYSNYQALQFSATKRFRAEGVWSGMALTGTYTWSHMIDNASEVFGPGLQKTAPPITLPELGFPGLDLTEPFEPSTPIPQDPANSRKGERGNSSFDRRHRFALSTVWALPSAGPKAARILLGNWEVNVVSAVQSGQPYTPVNSSVASSGGFLSVLGFASLGITPFGCGDAGGDGIVFNDRPNLGNPKAPTNTVALINNVYCLDPSNQAVSDFVNDPQNNAKINSKCGDYIAPGGKDCVADLNSVHFIQVPIGGGFGAAGRNIMVGPPTINFDLSLSKSFRFGERLHMRLRGDAYDLLNRQNPVSFAGNPYDASAQNVAAVAFYPEIALRSKSCLDPNFHLCQGENPTRTTLARVSGATPENSIDAVDPTTEKSLFLSRRFLTTSSRRVELSLKITF